MTEEGLLNLEIVSPVAGDTIVLMGRRGKLAGTIRIRNGEDRRVVLRNGELRNSNLPAAGAGQSPPSIPAAISAIIPPLQERLVRLTVEIDPYTAPGAYTGEVHIADASIDVKIHVAELVSPRISPDQLVIREADGKSIDKRIYVSNDGNTPITVRDHYDVELKKDVWARKVAGGDSESSMEQLANVLVGERTVCCLEDAGIMEVCVVEGGGDLEPGSTRELNLKITPPKELDSMSRYVGRLVMYTADLAFVVVPER